MRFCSITAKTFNTKNYQSRDFQNAWSTFFTFKIDGDIGKFVQILVNRKSTKLFKCLISSSILKIQRSYTTFWKAYLDLDLMHFISFINYRKSKTIFKTSLNSHVYCDTLYESVSIRLPTTREGRQQAYPAQLPIPKLILLICGTARLDKGLPIPCMYKMPFFYDEMCTLQKVGGEDSKGRRVL